MLYSVAYTKKRKICSSVKFVNRPLWRCKFISINRRASQAFRLKVNKTKLFEFGVILESGNNGVKKGTFDHEMSEIIGGFAHNLTRHTFGELFSLN